MFLNALTTKEVHGLGGRGRLRGRGRGKGGRVSGSERGGGRAAA